MNDSDATIAKLGVQMPANFYGQSTFWNIELCDQAGQTYLSMLGFALITQTESPTRWHQNKCHARPPEFRSLLN